MKVSIIGAGYVGLVTGTCLAEVGNYITCIDIDTAKIKRLQAGDMPIFEPQLEELVNRNHKEGRLQFSDDLAEGIKNAEVIFLTLATPQSDDGSANLSTTLAVAGQLGSLLKRYTLIVNKSTVPVGSTEQIYAKIAHHARVTFDVVSNPEFLREGVAIDDFMNPDRIVIGTSSEKARRLMQKLYAPFVEQVRPILFMDERSAELAKYAVNAFLVTRVTFINEIANICERVNANVDMVRAVMSADERIGPRFLQPGIGYGGSCFPKDTSALNHTATSVNYDFKLLAAAIRVNKQQPHVLIDKIKARFGNDLVGRKFAMWGLAFKPNTDDIREAPSLVIIDNLLRAGAHIAAFDPKANANVRLRYKQQKRLNIINDQYEVLKSADALIISTEWQEFKSPDFSVMKQSLNTPAIFDGRNIYRPEDMAKLGFDYVSIGR